MWKNKSKLKPNPKSKPKPRLRVRPYTENTIFFKKIWPENIAGIKGLKHEILFNTFLVE